MIIKEAHLFYEDDSSNKEYHLKIEKSGAGFKVIAEFGPRHGTLTYVDKTKGKPISWWDALDIFEKTEREKRRKGYEDIESFSKLIKHLKTKTGVSWIAGSDWTTIARAATEYFEGQ